MNVMETKTTVIIMLRVPIRMERTLVPATSDIEEMALRVKVCVHFNLYIPLPMCSCRIVFLTYEIINSVFLLFSYLLFLFLYSV